MIRLSAFSDEAAKDLSGQIAALKRNGISLMEIRGVDGKNVSSLTDAEALEYKKILDENGIGVWSIGSPIGKVDIETDICEYLEKVKRVCELANIFDTDKIRMFSFFNAYEKRDAVIEYLNKMVECAKEYGVTLYHENEKDIYGDTVERVVDIMESVPGIKLVYDPANFIQVGEDSEKSLNALHSKTDYFHIKDVISETGELVPAGCGNGNVYELVRRISDDKVLTIEPHLAVFDSYKQIDNTEMKLKYTFESNDAAFDAAVDAIKKILIENNYIERNGVFEKV